MMLPAETAGFWLRLALLGLAMGIGFIGWYLYVTRQWEEPPLLNQINAALTLEDRKPAAEGGVQAAAPGVVAGERRHRGARGGEPTDRLVVRRLHGVLRDSELVFERAHGGQAAARR